MVRSARLLLESSLDYAGTFPPAGLPLPQAVDAYARALGGPERWILGRFVVVAGSLSELERLMSSRAREQPTAPWELSVIASPERSRQLQEIAPSFREPMPAARTTALEFPPLPPEHIREMARRVPASVECFFELPLDAELERSLEAIAAAGGRAKVRTGGITAGAFPRAEDLVRFLTACAAAGVAFKATAGLHHAVRGSYPLTYETGSEVAAMHGLLNVAIAAALVRAGATPPDVNDALAEPSAEAFRFHEEGVSWRDHSLRNDELAEARRFFRSFGSCAIGAPVDELRALGLR